MPRLNIDDEWFDDPRREILASKVGPLVADGLAVRMWRLAQTYFRAGMLVPVDLFERIPHAREFEEAGLAERDAAGIYIRGLGRFEWLAKRAEAGRLGGSQPKSKSPEKSDDAPGKQTEANESKRKQVEASSSSSSSEENLKNIRRTYPTEFEEIYRKYPRQEGKSAGFKTYAKTIRSAQDRADLLVAVENYRRAKAGTEVRFLLMFSTFMNQWTDWLDPSTGKGAPAAPAAPLKTIEDLLKGSA